MENYEKLYKEALERAKDCCVNKKFSELEDTAQQLCEYVFPELRESEDERIRKELINFFSKGAEYDSSTNGIKDRNIIAWLEKQDTKFQEYINEERNKKDFYCEGKEMSWNEMPLTVRKHDYPYYFKGDLDCYPFNVEKQGEQNPSWSEEDEKILKRIDNLLYSLCQIHGSEYEKLHNWLKSLKPQNRWKPSEEQLEALWDIIPHIPNSERDIDTITELSALYEELKSL